MEHLDELRAAHDNLVERTRNLRADLSATNLLLDALVMTMPAEASAKLRAQFEQLSERYTAQLLATSTDPQDKTLQSMTRALAHAKARLAAAHTG
jgi:hypothetical protein